MPEPNPTRRVIILIAVIGALGLIGFGLYSVITRWLRPDIPPVDEHIEGTTWAERTTLPGRVIWASELEYVTSAYGEDSWSGSQALNAPNTFPEHGDHESAWASAEPDEGIEFIIVKLPHEVNARAVVVVETFNPGAIIRVDDLTQKGHVVAVWSGTTPPASNSRVSTFEFAQPRTMTALGVILDTTRVSGWNELDAIGVITADTPQALVPTTPQPAAVPDVNPPTPQPPIAVPTPEVDPLTIATTSPPAEAVWASELLSVSSEFEADNWSGKNALGPPNVYPNYGDHQSAWASSTQDERLEHITVGWPAPTSTSEIVIVETFNPGAIARVEDVSGQEPVKLWEGSAYATTPNTSQIFSLKLDAPRDIQRLRVTVDSPRIKGWNELDAIGLIP